MSFNLNQREKILEILEEMVLVLKEIKNLINTPATREAAKPKDHHEKTRL